MKTPLQVEQKLERASAQVWELLNTPQWDSAVKNAKQQYLKIRNDHGLKSAAGLLSKEISKLNKDTTNILGLALLPAKHSNIANVCAFADSCADSCVAFSGNGSFPSVFTSRLAKTELLTNNPKAFLTLLIHELLEATKKLGANNLAVRLNTYSDIRWERVAPWMFQMFKAVQFYDYTKHPVSSRPENTRPGNYHLTYSVSEKTTAQQLSQCADIGRPLAVVVAIRSGKQHTTEQMRPIPKTWAGMPTVDGDSSDARWTTPTGSVVILRRKHTMKTDHPMITTAEQLEEGTQP
jgi:hypothetical protein